VQARADAGRLALRCLDLTSLNDADTSADVARLCRRAQTRFGPVAAVCVWPRFAALARRLLPPSIAVAAVANFPAGGADIGPVLHEVREITGAGAQELDLVLPWRALRDGNDAATARLLDGVRGACPGLRLKVILETGELQDAALITRAAGLALAHGADFLKTSTGKTARGATPQAWQLLLQAVSDDAGARGRVGVKVSGGVRTLADALPYVEAVREVLGDAALQPQRFRIGASSLLDDIEAVLGGRPSNAASAGD
jgi:deoxyribose-phosphate aldolase